MIKDALIQLGLTEEQINKIIPVIDNNYVQVSQFKQVKEQLNKSKSQIDSISKEYQEQINKIKIDNAVEKSLLKSKAKNVTAVKALLNLNDAQLDQNGNVVGLEKQIQSLIKDNETSFLFDKKQNFKGIRPAESSDNITADPKKMNYEQLCNYMKQNNNL